MADTTTGTSVAIATPDLEIIEGQITTTSQQIAAHFGKRHDTVLRAIRNMECSAEYRLRNFAESSYRNEQGKEQPCYRLTRDGFVFLAMGFTGKDAAQWKEAYITAFNKMEQELLARTPYTVQPGQTLSAEQAQYLRTMLTDYASHWPKNKQGTFMMQGWSKLKAHFKTDYRRIPADQYMEAVNILARHIGGWLIEYKQVETTSAPVTLHDASRTRAAFDAAAQAAASVQTAVFNAVLSGNDEWKFDRWLLAFIDDSSRGAPAYVRQMDRGDFIANWPKLVKDVATGECMCSSAELLDMAAACMQRLQQRAPVRLAA